ncbi:MULTISPECIES: SRPBCC domain-containing protein [unclassified Streptomyces]|uniref:SRPBCC domain-containing protein n=1 Tax=unclassified Streptomyces TaxID=2593676 RepID=UPI00037047A8|nr:MULTISPECIES: SRPBCC domain-containing protein [unclassified Streptomyces]MYT30823.1 carbon monoxide dehydrogenase subunit G [Streptomyces sp. SID8354]
MEHEVYVPFPVGTVRQALTEPERVARCVPGVQLDADAAPHRPEGRLRLRIGGSTITYRGALTVGGGPDDGRGDGAAVAPVTIEANGTETRGDGTVALTLTVRPTPAAEPGPGTTLVCTGTVRSEGRLAAADGRSAAAAGRRLLDRFAENLAADLTDRPVTEAPEEAPGPVAPGLFDTEVPPSSLDPLADVDDALEEAAFGAEDVEDVEDEDGPGATGDPEELSGVVPAEAAHARRTMIGRSAEEVDHAPPRGRYAPVPAPEPGGSSVPLRWAAPAAAVVLASAVVVGRVLRRRR